MNCLPSEVALPSSDVSSGSFFLLSCSFFAAPLQLTYNTRENSVNYDHARTNQQNTTIVRHFARRSRR